MKLDKIFTPLKVGPITLANRILMAPLTRLRSAEPGDIPTPLMEKYYEQRATAGLVISEATQVSFQAKGYSGAPGLHTKEQILAWQNITRRIRDAKGHSASLMLHFSLMACRLLRPLQFWPIPARV